MKTEWIPVTERLPEEYDSMFAKYYGTDRWINGMFRKASKAVIVTVTCPPDKFKAVTTAHMVEGEWRCDALRMHEGANITAWMPLPEPYVEEKDE